MLRFSAVLVFIVGLVSCGGDSDTISGTLDPRADNRIKILAVGDSICTGSGKATGWADRIRSRGFEVIYKDCKNGRAAAEIGGSAAIWIRTYKPTHFIVLLGTNDAIRGSVGDALNALRYMVDSAVQENAIPIVGTLPVIDLDAEWEQKASAISNGIRGLGGARIAEIRNQFTLEMLSEDHLHPNDAGQEVIVEALLSRL